MCPTYALARQEKSSAGCASEVQSVSRTRPRALVQSGARRAPAGKPLAQTAHACEGIGGGSMPTNARARFDNAKRRRPENHDRQRQLTPAYILEPCRVLLGGFDLDPCTEPDNPTQARRYCCPPRDGCADSYPWWGSSTSWSVWCNPPYGEARGRWTRRCVDAGAEGSRVLLLIPAHTETRSTWTSRRSSIKGSE